jgi:hypothetical protein
MSAMELEVETTCVADIIPNVVAPPQRSGTGATVGTREGTDASRWFSLLSNHCRRVTSRRSGVVGGIIRIIVKSSRCSSA